MLNANFLFIYLLPLSLAILLAMKKFKEKTIVRLSMFSSVSMLFGSLFLFGEYLLGPRSSYEISLATIHYGEHHFSLNLFFDELTFLILFLTSFLSLMVSKFSGQYLHREHGFQRFFLIINFFAFGMNTLAMAGTMDLFFAGWEIVGLCSFLLVGFYHQRTRPTRNAFRIFSIYRVCDVGLLFSVILGHLTVKNADHFYYLINESELYLKFIPLHWKMVIFFLLMLSAMGKSAQFPFINWPARAMEGPTPSSAIFYGALSVHCGVFLLLRTYPIYKDSILALGFIFFIGLLSMLFAIGVGRVQSNVKGQIAYASVAQIGIMFMELALGWHELLLVHIALHSLLRCYQLLISPSIVVDHLKVMSEGDRPSLRNAIEQKLPESWRSTLFSFALQEGFLSISERGFFPLPLIRLKLMAKNYRKSLALALLSFAFFVFYLTNKTDFSLLRAIAYFFGVGDLSLTLMCLLSLENPRKIWKKFLWAQLFFVVANVAADIHTYHGIVLYLVSAVPCWFFGWLALSKIPDNIDLTRYHGFYLTHQKSYRYFLLAFIGLAGYPLTTIFWAEDILFAELVFTDPALLFLTALSLMMNGLVAGKILVKTYWGFPNQVSY